jgi:hypothetical protein
MAVLESVAFAKYFIAYLPVIRQGEGLFFAGPNILERKFRDSIEVYKEDDSDKWFLTSATICALTDALLQVRDAIGQFCGTLNESKGSPGEYTSVDPLYRRFREMGLTWPLEPTGICSAKAWERSFDSLPDLLGKVSQAQVWGIWMMCVLHTLAKAEDRSCQVHCSFELPPFPSAQMARAIHAYKEWRAANIGGYAVLDDDYAPQVCGDMNVSF